MEWQFYLGPPVITHDGDTLKISRGARWGIEKRSMCLFLSVWLPFWSVFEYHLVRSLLFNIPEPHKGQPGPFVWISLLIWSYGGLAALWTWSRMIFLGGEEISIGPGELVISRKWANNWKARCYPLAGISNLRRGRRWPEFGCYSIRFDCQGRRVWLQPTSEEPEHLAMLNALQEHLARQQVQ
jgi:hypothetical protein